MARADHHGITDLRKAAARRKADAWRLLGLTAEDRRLTMHARGAAHLGGYAIECKLKVLLLEIHQCTTLGELAWRLGSDERAVYSHGLEALGRLVPAVWARFRSSPVWRDFAAHVNTWRPSWRYSANGMTYEDALAFLKAVDRVYDWLDRNRG